MPEIFPDNVFNHDVVWLYDQFSRFYTELARSQSSPVSGMIVADQSRLQSYIDSIRNSLAWIQGQPQLDLPETHPRPYALESFPVEENVENEAINVVLRLLRAVSVELANSQSARFASRLQPFDEVRVVQVVDKVQAFLSDYIVPSTPIDLPESSPEASMTKPGNTGVLPGAA